MKIVTHNGHFHADELLAVATLLIKYPDAEVIRSRDEEIIKTGDIIVDVGHVYDPSRMRFDHHQPEGAGKRENGIPYASFGLIWKQFGQYLAGGEEEANILDEKLVMPIDALDNGVSISNPTFSGITEYSLGDYFESFSHGAKTLEESEQAFFSALPLASGLLKREIASSQRIVAGLREVRRIYDESKNKKIIVLPESMPWKRALVSSEAQFVIYPRTDGFWGLQVVPKSLENPFDYKSLFPREWAGLEEKNFPQVSGVDDALFCLTRRWLAGARSKEGAIKLAEIALNA